MTSKLNICERGTFIVEIGGHQVEVDANQIRALWERYSGWQPIITAPKNGTRIDIWFSDIIFTHPKSTANPQGLSYPMKGYRAANAWFEDGEWRVDGDRDYDYFVARARDGWEPSHWMPLPGAP